jgi:8-oxo-dGTP diphosphatase
MRVTIDFVSFRLIDQVIQVLVKKRVDPALPDIGLYGLIGGAIREQSSPDQDDDQTLGNAMRRIVKQNFGHVPIYTEATDPVGTKVRDMTRGWSVTIPHLAFFNDLAYASFDADDDYMSLPITSVIKQKVVSAEQLKSMSKKEKLAFDHARLISQCFEALKIKASYSSIALYMLGDEFTMPDIVHVFSLMGIATSKQTVINRCIKTKLIVPTGNKVRHENGGKPAVCYRLSSTNLHYFSSAVGK